MIHQPPTMKAWFASAYGGPDVLALRTIPVPDVAPNEVLIRICASTVSSADSRIRGFRLPRGFGLLGRLALGLSRPRQPVLGVDLAGIVVTVGAKVRNWRPGDEVIAMSGSRFGCHADYFAIDSMGAVAFKPANLSFVDAAALPFGGTTALHFLRKADLTEGERLLVIGAAGAVGSAMVQIAKHKGAHVTAVTSARNQHLVRVLGADTVIDYAVEDALTRGEHWDIIVDTVGATSFKSSWAALKDGGRYVSIAGGLIDQIPRQRGKRRSIAGVAPELAADLAEISHLAAAGSLIPVIDRVYPFIDLPAAHAHVDTGHKRGSVVIQLAEGLPNQAALNLQPSGMYT